MRRSASRRGGQRCARRPRHRACWRTDQQADIKTGGIRRPEGGGCLFSFLPQEKDL